MDRILLIFVERLLNNLAIAKVVGDRSDDDVEEDVKKKQASNLKLKYNKYYYMQKVFMLNIHIINILL